MCRNANSRSELDSLPPPPPHSLNTPIGERRRYRRDLDEREVISELNARSRPESDSPPPPPPLPPITLTGERRRHCHRDICSARERSHALQYGKGEVVEHMESRTKLVIHESCTPRISVYPSSSSGISSRKGETATLTEQLFDIVPALPRPHLSTKGTPRPALIATLTLVPSHTTALKPGRPP
ncbi:hypothetical protein FISHEDRAFT_59270 [Fistulina hepatica ATCC 64428]|uniref:Uncharacterized protein n=1 Tax=Fistulina hepatica ATCC 64428 TaxID=1128425 RepID=A0A0D7AC27_9AGAR|nr:hypothetical protein FISHEDRAFT_59270 [Fistulina hepatica ATCC 64428]